jgi:hypothetical protein
VLLACQNISHDFDFTHLCQFVAPTENNTVEVQVCLASSVLWTSIEPVIGTPFASSSSFNMKVADWPMSNGLREGGSWRAAVLP